MSNFRSSPLSVTQNLDDISCEFPLTSSASASSRLSAMKILRRSSETGDCNCVSRSLARPYPDHRDSNWDSGVGGMMIGVEIRSGRRRREKENREGTLNWWHEMRWNPRNTKRERRGPAKVVKMGVCTIKSPSPLRCAALHALDREVRTRTRTRTASHACSVAVAVGACVGFSP